MPAPSWLKSIAQSVNRVASASSWSARVHLAMSRWLASGASPFRRQQVLNSLTTVTWPDRGLVPQRVRLGAETCVWLQPHNGKFDFAAVLVGTLNYEPEIFSFLDCRVRDYDAVVEIEAKHG